MAWSSPIRAAGTRSLFVLAPIALFSVLLFIANKRAARLVDEEEQPA